MWSSRRKRQPPPRARAPRHRGFSLLEVTIALGLLGFGILAIGAAQLASVRFNSESRLRTEAYYLAQQQLEAFRGMNTAGLDAAAIVPLDPASPIDPDPTDALPRSFMRSWTITADDPDPGLYTVRVQVSWIGALGLPRNVSIESVTAGT